MKAIVPIVLILLFSASLTAGAITLSKQRKYLKAMRPEFAGAKLVQTTPDGFIANVYLKIKNTTGMDITIPRQSYKILLNHTPIQTIERNEPLVLKGNAETTAVFPVTITPKQSLQGIISGLQTALQTGLQAGTISGLDNINITIMGELSVDSTLAAVDQFKFKITKSLKSLLTNFAGGNFAGYDASALDAYQNPVSGWKVPPMPMVLYSYPIVTAPSKLSETGAISQL